MINRKKKEDVIAEEKTYKRIGNEIPEYYGKLKKMNKQKRLRQILSVFLEDAGALECLAECWEKAKAVCIEAELAEDDTSWYRLYQVLNSKMNANT